MTLIHGPLTRAQILAMRRTLSARNKELELEKRLVRIELDYLEDALAYKHDRRVLLKLLRKLRCPNPPSVMSSCESTQLEVVDGTVA